MRTVLVNPMYNPVYAGQTIPRLARTRGRTFIARGGATRRLGRTARRRGFNANPMMANPRRRRRNYANPANPLILNPRRRRRNPANPSFSMAGIGAAAYNGVLGGGSAYLLNRLALQYLGTKLEGDVRTDTENGWIFRSVARVLVGALGAVFLPPSAAAAFNGAMYYPIMRELDHKFVAKSAYPTEADLQAELSDVLDADLNDEDF